MVALICGTRVHLGDARRVAEEGGEGEEGEVAPREDQDTGQLVDVVGDEKARAEQHQQEDRWQVGQRPPPALAAVEEEVGRDERDRRRVEDVGLAGAGDVLGADGEGRRRDGHVPALVRVEDEGDDQGGEECAVR